MQSESQARAVPCRLLNLSEEARRILDLIDPETLTRPPLIPEQRTAGLMDQLGEASLRFADDLVQVITFLGDLLTSLWFALLHPRSVRWGDVLFYMKRAGVDGLPIIGLISLLLGLIMAFMSSLQLKQFGANIYVASLLAVAMVQELGPIMTAILVAGRSGSAFAAEIGTMKVNEEVDALVTMGFDPVRFLAIPKVLAAMLVVPLLTVYATLFGTVGRPDRRRPGPGPDGFLLRHREPESHRTIRYPLQPGQIRGLCPADGRHRLPAGFPGARRRRGGGLGHYLGRGGGHLSDYRHRLGLRPGFALHPVRIFTSG